MQTLQKTLRWQKNSMMSCGKKEKKGGSSVRFGGSPNRDLASRHDKHANRKRLLPRVILTHFE
jgi:hypothetical protein